MFKSLKVLSLIATCLMMTGVAKVWGQDAPPRNAKAESAVASAKPPSREKSPEERARALAARLKTALNQEPDELVRMAREISATVSAALDFDCELAELEQRETLLERRQEQLQATRDAARAAAEKLRTDLEARREAIRRQFGTASSAETQALHARLAQHFGEQIRSRQGQADQCEKEIQKVNTGLAGVRRHMAEQRLARELVAQSGRALETESAGPLDDIDLDFSIDLALEGIPEAPRASPAKSTGSK